MVPSASFLAKNLVLATAATSPVSPKTTAPVCLYVNSCRSLSLLSQLSSAFDSLHESVANAKSTIHFLKNKSYRISIKHKMHIAGGVSWLMADG
jgi:hypothetical protein